MVRGSLFYYAGWAVRKLLLGARTPLTGSVIVTDRCNLSCQHCIVANLGYADRSYADLCGDVRLLYQAGVRMLVLTGGEPLLWQDGAREIDDLVDAAKAMGFFRTVICTNGTLPLSSRADYLWVSLDGLGARHDELRNAAICRTVVANIAGSSHPNIKVNYTINRLNLDRVVADVETILGLPNVRGVFLHLVTPYLGLEQSPVLLGEQERRQAIESMRELKRRYRGRIVNSLPGLDALATGRWERPVWGSLTVCNGEVGPCCCRRGIYDERVCQACGCSPAVETWALQSLRPGTLLDYLQYL